MAEIGKGRTEIGKKRGKRNIYIKGKGGKCKGTQNMEMGGVEETRNRETKAKEKTKKTQVRLNLTKLCYVFTPQTQQPAASLPQTAQGPTAWSGNF